MQEPPSRLDNWVGLLIAIIARARSDISTPTLPDELREDAAQFLSWVESEGRELQADLANWLRGR
jgi:hypothetical protein